MQPIASRQLAPPSFLNKQLRTKPGKSREARGGGQGEFVVFSAAVPQDGQNNCRQGRSEARELSGCSNRSFNKAAGSLCNEAYVVQYVEQATENAVEDLFQQPRLEEGHCGIGDGGIVLVGNASVIAKDLPFLGLDQPEQAIDG